MLLRDGRFIRDVWDVERTRRVLLHNNTARRQALVRHVIYFLFLQKRLDGVCQHTTPSTTADANKVQGAFIYAIITAITM